jgi:FtsP/CotA-like multicopper oxidase with cupredoxin domain
MAGLVLGITTVDRVAAARSLPTPTRHLRLFAQQAPGDSGKPARHGYVLQQNLEPKPDSVEVPGTPLVLTRGETTAITVINRLREPTTVHWHGMELESVFDGVAGWSRTGSNLAPLVAPGDSFTVAFTPPRSGTFIYHTHMDEGVQLGAGMYGPLLVLEPGQRYDPATDLVFIVGNTVVSDSVRVTLNGRREPPPLTLRAGTRYRLRFINILSAPAIRVEMSAASQPLSWRLISKDGADLEAAVRTQVPAKTPWIGVGETYDFEWTPAGPTKAVIEVQVEGRKLRQVLHVLPAAP